jgi:hypothetical protein
MVYTTNWYLYKTHFHYESLKLEIPKSKKNLINFGGKKISIQKNLGREKK